MSRLSEHAPSAKESPPSNRIQTPTPMQLFMLRSTFKSSRPNPPYIQQLRWRIKSKISQRRLKQAVLQTVARHPIFRQSFVSIDGSTAMREKPAAKVPYRLAKLRTEEASEAAIERIAEADFKAGFISMSESLCRFTLVQIGRDDHLLLWTSHHALFDGRGRLVAIEEILATYRTLQSGQSLELPPAPCYSEHLSWLESKDFSKSKTYWKRKLANTPQATSVPLRNKRNASGHGKIQKNLPRASIAALDAFTSKYGISPNIILQAAAGLALSKLCDQDHIVFGAPRACRYSSVKSAPETVGPFVNTLPVVVSPRQNQTVIELLKETQKNWKELREHEHSPHLLILENSGMQGPLFEILVAFERYQLSESLSETEPPFSHSKLSLKGFTDLPLSLQLLHGKRPVLETVFRKDTLDRRSAARIADYLLSALAELIQDPKRNLCEISILAPQDKVVFQQSASLPENCRSKTVAELFQAAAQTYPKNSAVVSKDESFDYQSLDERSNQLARYLAKKGVQAGDHIGLFFGHCHWMPIAALACLKLRAAYVPFDLEYPKERLNWMLKDAKITLALSTSDVDCPFKSKDLQTLHLDANLTRIKRHSPRPLKTQPSPDDAAYLMYTSGSTGKPKGVSIPQRAIARLVHQPNYVTLGPKTRLLQLAPTSFDAATFEIWGALLNGGACIIYPKRIPSIERLRAQLRIHKVNTLWLTASLFNFVIDTDPSILKHVRQILTGGEALSPSHVRAAQLALPRTRIINGYGPTENTTFSCCYPIPSPHPSAKPVPIGAPISGSTACVLDRNKQPMPIGALGELYVGGLGVGHGYLNRKALSRERFIANPFGLGRLYKTGDLASIDAKGHFHFQGRIDLQVKIHGHRIEPGEIQKRIAQRKDIQQAVVFALPDEQGETKLFAAIVTKKNSSLTPERLAAELKKSLPSYMIPSRIIPVDRIPITPNGKTDCQAILNTRLSSSPQKRIDKQLLTKTEKSVFAIWKQVLKYAPQSIETDFIEAGGNSLLATLLVYKLTQKHKTSFPLASLENHASIQAQAQWIDDNRAARSPLPPLKLRRLPQKDRYPAPKPVAYLADLKFKQGISRTDTIVRANRLNGPLNTTAFEKALNSLFIHHEELRAQLIQDDGKYYITNRLNRKFTLQRVDLSQLPRKKAIAQAEKIFDSDNRSFIQVDAPDWYTARLIKISDTERYFILSLLHAIADARSIEIVYQHISSEYNRLTGNNCQAPDLPKYTFREFRSAYEKWHAPQVAQSLKSYWINRIKHLKPAPLPIERNIQAAKPIDAHIENVALDRKFSESIKAFSERQNLSVFVFMLSVYQLLLSRYSGLTEPPVGTYTAYRYAPELERTMGNFADTTFVNFKFPKSQPYQRLISDFKKSFYAAIDHPGYQECEIYKYLPNHENWINSPSLQFFFTKGDLSSALNLNGIETTPLHRKRHSVILKQSIFLRKNNGRFTLSLFYPKTLYKKSAITRFLYNYQNFLALIIDNPNITLSQLPDLSSPQGVEKPLSKTERNLNRFSSIS